MEKAASIANFFQQTLGSISFSGIDHRWLIVAFAVFVVALIIFSQEKAKAIMILTGIYGLWFAASLIPGVMQSIEKAVPAREFSVMKIIFGALPIAVLVAVKKKKRSSPSATYSFSRRSRRSEY